VPLPDNDHDHGAAVIDVDLKADDDGRSPASFSSVAWRLFRHAIWFPAGVNESVPERERPQEDANGKGQPLRFGDSKSKTKESGCELNSTSPPEHYQYSNPLVHEIELRSNVHVRIQY